MHMHPVQQYICHYIFFEYNQLDKPFVVQMNYVTDDKKNRCKRMRQILRIVLKKIINHIEINNLIKL